MSRVVRKRNPIQIFRHGPKIKFGSSDFVNLDRMTSIEVYSRSSAEARHKLFLSRLTNSELPNLIFGPCRNICIGFLFSQPQTYIKFILKAVAHAESNLVTQCLILSERSYCVFTPRVLLSISFLFFIVDELKNFAANNLFKLLKLVTYWDQCTLVSHVLRFVYQEKDCHYNTGPIGY